MENIAIEKRREPRRGCGYRKKGGLYLVCDGPGRVCCKLPRVLTVCPTCHAGIKPARGWTWVDADALFAGEACNGLVLNCPLAGPIGRAGLLWVGGKYYPTPGAFQQEALLMGISRRIPAIPEGFELEKTWVLLAHRRGVQMDMNHVALPAVVKDAIEKSTGKPMEPDLIWLPAIFHVFKPSRIEYVVKGNESGDTLKRLVKRGVTLVDVVPGEQQPLFKEAHNA